MSTETPDPAYVDDDAHFDDDEDEETDADTAPAPAPAANVVKFSGKRYTTWAEALKSFQRLRNKAPEGQAWKRLEAVEATDGSFKLRCASCAGSCQLANPNKWFKEHKCKRAGTIDPLSTMRR